jgi:hypothetical protein
MFPSPDFARRPKHTGDASAYRIRVRRRDARPGGSWVEQEYVALATSQAAAVAAVRNRLSSPNIAEVVERGGAAEQQAEQHGLRCGQVCRIDATRP